MGYKLKLAVVSAVALTFGACVVQAPPNNQGGGGGNRPDNAAAAEEACRAALVAYHNVNDVRVIGSEPYQGRARYVRASVRAGAGGKREIWQCIAYRGGRTGELQYLSDDATVGKLPERPGRPAVGSEYDLTEFQGARAGQAEGGIRSLGYESIRTRGLTTWWFNRSTGACARITTSNGRYSTVTMLPAEDC